MTSDQIPKPREVRIKIAEHQRKLAGELRDRIAAQLCTDGYSATRASHGMSDQAVQAVADDFIAAGYVATVDATNFITVRLKPEETNS